MGLEAGLASALGSLLSPGASLAGWPSELFLRIEPGLSLKILRWIHEHAALMGLEEHTLAFVEAKIRDRFGAGATRRGAKSLYTIRPNVSHLMQADVFKLEHGGSTYYVPLWHDELTFDEEKGPDGARAAAHGHADADAPGQFVVTCGPRMPEHMRLDDDNNLHVSIQTRVGAVLRGGGLDFDVGGLPHHVPASQLTLEPFQTARILGKGPPRINVEDPFDVARRADIWVHLHLLDETKNMQTPL